jgi:hypothetical protein
MTSLPASSGVEHAEMQRSLRHLRFGFVQLERAISDRSFRLWALVTLNALDLLTTAAVLALGGSESNPAMQGVVQHWWKPFVVKGLVLALLWATALRTPPRSKAAALGLAAVWIFYAGVVGWNTLLLIRY